MNKGIDNITLPVFQTLKKQTTRLVKVNNIMEMSDKELNDLRCGDIVQKKTGNQRHAYVVTYKQEKHGICLSYFDGSGYIETVSYDYTNGHWVYNSTDVMNVGEELANKLDKNIISQIKKNTTQRRWELPKGIFPIRITIKTSSEVTVYPKTLSVGQWQLCDSDGLVRFTLGKNTTNGTFFFINDGGLQITEIKDITYVIFNNNENGFASFGLYYPVSGGTQLYKHTINYKSSVSWQSIEFFSTNDKELTEATGSDRYNLLQGILQGFGPGTGAKNGFMLTNMMYGGEYISFKILNFSSGNVETFNLAISDLDSDTVNPL